MRAWLVLLIAASTLGVGCLAGQDGPPIYDGIGCSLFDPSTPATTARLEAASDGAQDQQPGPQTTTFTLLDAQGDTLEHWRFPDEACIPVSIPGPGTYTFHAQAPHPDDGCSFVDEEQRTFDEHGYADVHLTLEPRCSTSA